MIPEHEIGILTEALPKLGLRAGDTGVVVAVLGEGAAYLVEFFTPEGDTIDVVYVEGDQIRPRTAVEIPTPRARPPLIPDGRQVSLTNSIPEYGLHVGDEGVVLRNHQGGIAYALEFTRDDGSLVRPLCVLAEDLRPVKKAEPKRIGSLSTHKGYARASSSTSTARATK